MIEVIFFCVLFYTVVCVNVMYVCLQLPGDRLDDSGWLNALVQTDIAGVPNSFIRGSHAHHITKASLYGLLSDAYSQDSF